MNHAQRLRTVATDIDKGHGISWGDVADAMEAGAAALEENERLHKLLEDIQNADVSSMDVGNMKTDDDSWCYLPWWLSDRVGGEVQRHKDSIAGEIDSAVAIDLDKKPDSEVLSMASEALIPASMLTLERCRKAFAAGAGAIHRIESLKPIPAADAPENEAMLFRLAQSGGWADGIRRGDEVWWTCWNGSNPISMFDLAAELPQE